MAMFKKLGEAISANVNHAIDKNIDPSVMTRYYAAKAQEDLEKTRLAVAEVVAEKMAAERKVEETKLQIKQLAEYAELAVQANNLDDAKRFLNEKAKLTVALSGYEKAAASTKDKEMREIYEKQKEQYDKMISEIPSITADVSIARAQDRVNSYNSVTGKIASLFRNMKDKAANMLDVANAEAKMIESESIDSLKDKYTSRPDVDAELAELVAKHSA